MNEEIWREATRHLSAGVWSLLALWAESAQVHMALADGDDHFGMITVQCRGQRYPSVARAHPPAIRLERAIRDLWGLQPEGLPDQRPWLDHGTWQRAPNGGACRDAAIAGAPYEFLPADGESLHQIAVGPVHAGIIEPGHFRFTANGEAVVRLEARLGYVHKGIERLMAGMPVERAARLAGRISGDSTVAYSFAFARAIEMAHGIEVPPRAVWLRALMAELERLANHFGDIGAICNDAAFAMMHAQCGHLRELVLRACDRCFGHRLMMDQVVPGGVGRDLQREGSEHIRALVDESRRRFPELMELYDNTASLQDRTVGTGILSGALARQYACGGTIGRASGRTFDARRTPGCPPYDGLEFDVPVRQEGDVDARVWIRIREVEQSLSLIDQIVRRLPPGPIAVPVAPPAGAACEGAAMVEGFRGDVFVWLRTNADGHIERCHLRDPSWFQWPLLEAVIEGNIVADFPLCNKSFNCSYAGHDG
ncbi:MAG TPA: NADH-quinone oxidoreductase subunit C [Burkholderiaceae bacterium]|nr:NADH-quinone oxidoreductase subunit C [Burkholderiaceae bacterium]